MKRGSMLVELTIAIGLMTMLLGGLGLAWAWQMREQTAAVQGVRLRLILEGELAWWRSHAPEERAGLTPGAFVPAVPLPPVLRETVFERHLETVDPGAQLLTVRARPTNGRVVTVRGVLLGP